MLVASSELTSAPSRCPALPSLVIMALNLVPAGVVLVEMAVLVVVMLVMVAFPPMFLKVANGALLGPYRCVGMLTVLAPRPPSFVGRTTKLRANVSTSYLSLRRIRVW